MASPNFLSFSNLFFSLFLLNFCSFYNPPGSRKIDLQVTFPTPLKMSNSELKRGRTARNSEDCAKIELSVSTARGSLYRARSGTVPRAGWLYRARCNFLPQICLGFRVLLRSSSSLLRIASRSLRWLRNLISYSMEQKVCQ